MAYTGDSSSSSAEFERRTELAGLTEAAERLDGLGEMAELMGDSDGADQLRDAATTARLRAMRLLDDGADDR